MLLTNKGNLASAALREELLKDACAPCSAKLPGQRIAETFLRIPPFPGSCVAQFATTTGITCNPAALLSAVRRLRVGGDYWAAQPWVPSKSVLVRSLRLIELAAWTFPRHQIVVWAEHVQAPKERDDVVVVSGRCDPWHMLAGASALMIEEGDQLGEIAAVLGVPCYTDQRDRAVSADVDPAAFAEALASTTFVDPFFGSPMDAIQAAELCGFWRQLIDSNRGLSGGAGFAFWKQDHVAPLLWGGTGSFRFLRSADEAGEKRALALWRAKAAPELVAALERKGIALVEVEDGFLRSRGLGADCIPPLSITVDHLGAHFDPGHPSELELLLELGRFDTATIERSRELRALIVEAGIGKYGRGTVCLERPAGERTHILVPGQVEDDRAVVAGGCGLSSNLDLLKRVREQQPDAFIIYKPHPDIVAGHRRGAIPEATCLRYADKIVVETPIAAMIAMVDEVHVNTSLAGFEALLREKKVTTYGVPFYAGWGLTQDLGPVPARRTARRTLDELVAATLLLYPRYLDPLTGLPCPAEVLVARLSAAEDDSANLLVGMRRLQGKLMRRLRSVIQ